MSSEFYHRQSHFLSFWIFSLLVPGSYDQKLLNCLLHPSLQKETSCLFMNCSHVTDLANSLLSFPLGLWVFRGHQIFLSEYLCVSFDFLVILFWLISNTKIARSTCMSFIEVDSPVVYIYLIRFIIFLPSKFTRTRAHTHTCMHGDRYLPTSFFLNHWEIGTWKHFCVVSKEILLCNHSTILKSRTF